MTFEEYARAHDLYFTEDYESDEFQIAREAWEAGWAEGLAEGYDKGYDDTGICPECLNEVKHKMDCGRGR